VGEHAGHPFRGNQWTNSQSGVGSSSPTSSRGDFGESKIIKLEGGAELQYNKHPREEKNSNTWTVKSNGGKVGEITVDKYPDQAYPSIRSITLDEEVQGKGLGRKVVLALANHYGGLTSDPQGNTNDRANRMWAGIPGVHKVPTTRSYTKNWIWQIRGY
jgi:hypothetical protein